MQCDGLDTNASELSFRRYAYGSSPASSAALSHGDAASTHGARRRNPSPSGTLSDLASQTHSYVPHAPMTDPVPGCVLAPCLSGDSPPAWPFCPLSAVTPAATTDLAADPPAPEPAAVADAGVDAQAAPGRPADLAADAAPDPTLSHSSGTLSTHAAALPLWAAGDSNAAATPGDSRPEATSAAMSVSPSDSSELSPAASSAAKGSAPASRPASPVKLPQPVSEPLPPQRVDEDGALARSSSMGASWQLPPLGRLSSVEVRAPFAAEDTTSLRLNGVPPPLEQLLSGASEAVVAAATRDNGVDAQLQEVFVQTDLAVVQSGVDRGGSGSRGPA